MIFVTVGTNEQAFDRLVDAAGRLSGEEPVVVQYGSAHLATVPPGWCDYLPFADMSTMMQRARCIVAHAGVGSILLAHRSGKRPIVMPRRHELGEAVDDHQVVLATRLASRGLVTVVNDVEELRGAVAASDHLLSLRGRGSETELLAAELRGYLLAHAQPRRARWPEPPPVADLTVSRPAAQAHAG